MGEERLGDHTGRQQNHIWSEEEVRERMATLYRHTPVTWSDRIVNVMVIQISYNLQIGIKIR
jgi:competence transcription factor ComK